MENETTRIRVVSWLFRVDSRKDQARQKSQKRARKFDLAMSLERSPGRSRRCNRALTIVLSDVGSSPP